MHALIITDTANILDNQTYNELKNALKWCSCFTMSW